MQTNYSKIIRGIGKIKLGTCEKKVNVLRIINNKQEKINDLVAREVQFSIILNGKKIKTLACSPKQLKALGLGYLLTTGSSLEKELINTLRVDITNYQMHIETKKEGKIEFQEGVLKREIIEFYHPRDANKDNEKADFLTKVKINHIFSLISEIEDRASLFKNTGGAHSCALADKEGKILQFSEDISRHCAIDKIIGETVINGIDRKNKIIVTSCRITSGILKKIMTAGIPIVLSRAAPTDISIRLAQKNGISLIGFARRNTMNVYSFPERIAM